MHVGRRTRSRALTWLAGLLAAALTVVVAPLPAAAAPNSEIRVGPVSVTVDDGGPAVIGDMLTVSGAWDASQADPQPGDTFTIGLPPELGFTAPFPFALTGPDGFGDIQTWANCLTDPDTSVATCTLTDVVAANPEDVKGTFEFGVQAVRATTVEELQFVLNGEPVKVPFPGGIDDGVVVPTDWSKSGQLASNKWSVNWTIDLPGAALAGHPVVNVAERLGTNHQLCTPANLKVTAVRGTTATDVSDIAEIVPGADQHRFTIRLTMPEGGWDSGRTYRITYATCTPDGEIDPKDTLYENEAIVDIWGDASSGVIGVAQDWSFTGVAKAGSVLGGAERNGRIQWTVTVGGDQVSGKNAFTFAEQLSGSHAVCSDTVSGLRVVERYGPSTERQRDVTAHLEITETAASADSFELEIAARDGFHFQASPYVYVLTYRTCATTDGLPESGTAFANQASVNGTVASTTARVPARAEGKSGRINTTDVVLDGVTHPLQTTLGWTVTVPGERVAGIHSDLTLTDQLSSAHQVCVGRGGTVADRLGLQVQARDQISGGGLSTVTIPATATVDGDGLLTITIPQPTLALPGGGTATGFSAEYQYVVTYTTCTTSGGMDAPGTEYGNSVTVAGKIYKQTLTQTNKGAGTGQGVPRGSVSVHKELADTAGADLVPAGTEFTVHVAEIDPTGVTQTEYDLKVPAGGDPVSGFNSRGSGWTIRLTEPSFPSVPGVVFGTPRFVETPGVTVSDDGATALVTLTPNTNIDVTLVNEAKLGAVTLTKEVTGGAAALVGPDREYTVTAQIDTSALSGVPAPHDRTIHLTAGAPVVIGDLPIGATVTFTEQTPDTDDVLTWGTPTFSPEHVVVTDAHATTPAAVTLTNSVERTRGTFSLVKRVTGAQAENPAVPDEVVVTASWTQDGTPETKTLRVPTDGTPVPLGEALYIGTQVTLTETPIPDGSSIAWGAPAWTGNGVRVDGASAVVTIDRDPDTVVTLENHAATSTAGISLIKSIAGEAADEVDPDATFPVTVQWTDEEGPHTKTLRIGTQEPTELGVDLPAGTVVTITEGEGPAIPTVVWGSVTIAGRAVADGGDGTATVTVSDQQGDDILVTVVNEATWAPGTLAVAKTVTGIADDHPDLPATVTVVAEWTEFGPGGEPEARVAELTVPADGTAVPLGRDLPHGTVVTLTETALAGTAAFAWDVPVWGGDATPVADSGRVEIAAAATAEVALVNRAVPTLGALALTKNVTGAGAAHLEADATFPVTVSWTDLLGEPQRVTVEVAAGETTTVPEVPYGVPVRIEETDGTANGAVFTGAQWTTADERVTLDADGAVAAVILDGEPTDPVELTVVNTYDREPNLPATGLDAVRTVLMGAAALLLTAAGVWLVRRRRRVNG